MFITNNELNILQAFLLLLLYEEILENRGDYTSDSIDTHY